jgi:hypothetical protein
VIPRCTSLRPAPRSRTLRLRVTDLLHRGTRGLAVADGAQAKPLGKHSGAGLLALARSRLGRLQTTHSQAPLSAVAFLIRQDRLLRLSAPLLVLHRTCVSSPSCLSCPRLSFFSAFVFLLLLDLSKELLPPTTHLCSSLCGFPHCNSCSLVGWIVTRIHNISRPSTRRA